MSEGLTDGLRRRLAEKVECQFCHQPLPGDTMRSLAEKVGVPTTVVWRFLKGGDMTGRNLDKVAAFLADPTR